MNRLLVTGMFRSGATLPAVALAVSPGVHFQIHATHYFFKFVRNLFIKEISGRADFDAESPLGVDYFFSNQERTRFESCLADVEFDSALLHELREETRKEIDRDRSRSTANSRSDSMLALLSSIKPGTAREALDQIWEGIQRESRRELRVAGIKELYVDDFVLPLLGAYGDTLRGLHIVRDPRAVLASRNAGNYLDTQGGGRKYPLLLIARIWRRGIATFIRLSGTPQYRMMRYEDLVADPRSNLELLCDWVGIPFDPEMTVVSSLRDQSGTQWVPNTSYSRKTSIDTDSVSRWRSVLSTDEAAALEYICGPEMEALGYEADRDRGASAWQRYAEDATQYPEWLRRYDYCPTPEAKSYEAERLVAIGSGAIGLGEELPVDHYARKTS